VTALALTYHGVEEAAGPLFVSPDQFAAQLDAIAASGARVVTIRELAALLRAGDLGGLAVAISFDDGFASVPRAAAPLLRARGMTATIFCVAGRLGTTNAWPSQRESTTSTSLAQADELAELADGGFEIGSHGLAHDPLVGGDRDRLALEVVDARSALEDAVGTAVTTFAYPYGAGPSPEAAELVRETYDAACTTRPGHLTSRADPFLLPRFDVHYLRRPERLARVLAGGVGPYLRGRFVGARARRALRPDFVESSP
jgi:peptidoglycan/xylan/chitin deacetylase (PgdA/CDA1 family)